MDLRDFVMAMAVKERAEFRRALREAAGVDAQTVSNWEHRRSRPAHRYLAAIVATTGGAVTAQDLYG